MDYDEFRRILLEVGFQEHVRTESGMRNVIKDVWERRTSETSTAAQVRTAAIKILEDFPVLMANTRN